MKHLLLSLLLLVGYWPVFAQRPAAPKARKPPGQLQVIYVMASTGLERERLNLENDSLMTEFVEEVQRGLNYKLTIRRLSKKDFTTKALRDMVAALRTNPEDVIILYYAGPGLRPDGTAVSFANWQLDDVAKTGLPVSTVETWLKLQKAHLGLIIADYSTKVIRNNGVSAMTILTVDLTKSIIHQLFMRQCGIVKLGSSGPSAPAYINPDYDAGSVFTNALHHALSIMLSTTDPTTLPGMSFETLRAATERDMAMSLSGSGFDQTPVLEANPCRNYTALPPRTAARTIPGQTAMQRSPLPSAGTRWQGLRMDEDAYKNLPQKGFTKSATPLPTRIDLSKYAPPVINQGDKGTCVAVSIGYYMLSILDAQKRGLTDKTAILKRSGSPFYLYNAVKEPTDGQCTFGIDAGQTLDYLKHAGLPSFSAFPDPGFCDPQTTGVIWPSSSSRIQDYVKLFRITETKEAKVRAVKQALAEKAPVVVGIQTTNSMGSLSFVNRLVPRLKSAVTTLIFSDGSKAGSGAQWQPSQSNSLAFGHAMCVVGYDDALLGTGAFKLINSWGPSWGDNGYFWMSYADFGRFAKYGYQAYAPTNAPILLDTDLTIWSGAYRKTLAPFTTVPTQTPIKTYALTGPQHTGTSFKFRVAVKKQTYLYLLTANATDSVTLKLLPVPGYKTIIAPGNQVDYPSDNTSLTLTGSTGKEYWLFLLSSTEISDIDERLRAINGQKGPFPERVVAAFGSALMGSGQVDYKPKKMGFFVKNQPGIRGRIVPLLVTLNHVP